MFSGVRWNQLIRFLHAPKNEKKPAAYKAVKQIHNIKVG